ncbi:MAG: cell division control protein Cdc6 [Candidatus Diapherotrites archaeon CG09_land_8_20_14_0_10_32_12]|nr:MAG: cell division control protein Cdc6 [Candidatus Diapherotrites archaeon CG09_land_8_20_14_0_10_32_12]
MVDIKEMFKSEIKKNSVFKNKNIVSPHYIPDILPFRDDQIKEIISNLAPALQGKKINNLFLYGKTGTGKTSTIKVVLSKMEELAKERTDCKSIVTTYINCRNHNTKYRIILKHINDLYKHDYVGYSSSFVYDKLAEYVKKNKIGLIIVLDEIDLIKDVDDAVYALTRANDELTDGSISIVGISNNVMFKQKLDPRTKSSLCEKELVFPPYNAHELTKILQGRVEEGFNKDCVDDSAIGLASAYAAQESGDARTAILLLLRAGEIADENKEIKITETDVRNAKKTVEKDILLNMVSTLPEQLQYVLFAITRLTKSKNQTTLGPNNEGILHSGEVYNEYYRIAKIQGKSPVSLKWFKQYLEELELYGMIATTISGKGVRGTTTLIKLGVDAKILTGILEPKIGI